jgi:hypothetical protein
VNNYSILIQKLDAFIRKYYKNQLLRGAIYTVAGLLSAFIAAVVMEYYGEFSTTLRLIISLSFVAIGLFILVKYIFTPLTKLYKLSDTINYEQAANIIGTHFADVKDKLLNAIQLHDLAGHTDSELLKASIDQKIQELKPVPFSSAVNFSENRRYIKYAVPSVLLFIGIIFINSRIITESARRLSRPTTFFEKQAPFTFELENAKLEALQHEDFDLNLKVSGEELPAEVYAIIDGHKYKMEKTDALHFTYPIRNIQQTTPVQFFASGFSSHMFEIEVLAKPSLLNFSARINYPNYLARKDETIENTGDLVLPAGSTVTWTFGTSNADEVVLRFDEEVTKATRKNSETFTYTRKFLRNEQYSITTNNARVIGKDSIPFHINVVADEFPSIGVIEAKDSLSDRVYYYAGDIDDDHGFTRLTFNYKFLKSADSAHIKDKVVSVPININPNAIPQKFFHQFDLNTLNIQPEEEIEYYFEIWDNDGVNGAKPAQSKIRVYKAPSASQMRAEENKQDKEVVKRMDDTYKEVKELQKQIDELQKKLIDKKNLTWQDKKQIQDLIDKQKNLQQKLEELSKKNEQNNFKQNEQSKPNDELLEKQKELQRLMEEVMTPEMKKMFEELQKMLDQGNKEQIQEQLDKMKLTDKDVEKELDRNMEMFKQMKVEEKLEKAMEALDKLQQEQEKLAQDAEKKDADAKDLKEKQDEINKKMDDVEKQLEEVKKENKELEDPKDIQDTREEEEQIEKDQKESSESLGKDKKDKASKSAKSAAKKMAEMKDKIEKGMADAEMQELEEDINTLRGILENLIQLSYDQEALMKELEKINGYNPQYVAAGQRQKDLKDDARIIEDSLFALSKRQARIEAFINREIGNINANMQDAIKAMGDRRTYDARNKQQYVMTSVNNLAVMLSEALKQMQEEEQQQQQMKKSGNGQCKKPGGKGSKAGKSKKPSAASVRKMQEELNRKMQDMQQRMKEGQMQPGQMSEEFAKMAAQQAALRRYLQQLQEGLKKEEGGTGNELGDLKKLQELMEQTEKELVYKNLETETLRRQQDILTRLLESEKAEREREQDNKRESHAGKETAQRIPPSMEEYIKQKNKEAEYLKTVSPNLNTYYKQKVKDYFKTLEK